MKIRQAFLQLKKFPDLMDLNPGLTKEEIQAFEEKNKLVLPDSYKNLLECFDGGEIFRPGTKIYGLGVYEGQANIKEINSSVFRSYLSLGPDYLIIASLNFGDLICINLNKNNDIIQWDHEEDSAFDSWDNLEDWLEFTIKSYLAYEVGD